MNRPLRITLIGSAVVLAAAGWSVAKGQQGRVLELQRAFSTCVFSTADRQFAAGAPADPIALAEQGFFNCQTEERAYLGYLRNAGLTPDVIDAAAVNLRLNVKNILRDVFNNPAKYAKPTR